MFIALAIALVLPRTSRRSTRRASASRSIRCARILALRVQSKPDRPAV